jgi:hypothetical protein
VSESADEHEHDHEEIEDVEDEGAKGEGDDDLDELEVDEETQHALDEMLDTIRKARVAPLILSTISTFASVAFGKLEMKDLPEAKAAIDVVSVLLPLLDSEIDDSIRRDFNQALTNLKVAYADAVAAPE